MWHDKKSWSYVILTKLAQHVGASGRCEVVQFFFSSFLIMQHVSRTTNRKLNCGLYPPDAGETILKHSQPCLSCSLYPLLPTIFLPCEGSILTFYFPSSSRLPDCVLSLPLPWRSIRMRCCWWSLQSSLGAAGNACPCSGIHNL